MRFVCLRYQDEAKREALSEIERAAHREECSAFDEELRRGGHLVVVGTFRAVEDAVTLRRRGGQVAVRGGPHVAIGERIGGVHFLDARDLNHAIQLMARHPGARVGALEIRAAEETINAHSAPGRP